MFKVAMGLMSVGALFAAAPAIAHGMEIGNDLERCSADAKGPAVLVDVRGFAASTGKVRVQSYPATRAAWLAKGEWLGRIDVPVKAVGGQMRFCMPVPQPADTALPFATTATATARRTFRATAADFPTIRRSTSSTWASRASKRPLSMRVRA